MDYQPMDVQQTLSPQWYQKTAANATANPMFSQLLDSPDVQQLIFILADSLDVENLLSFYSDHWVVIEQPSFLHLLTQAFMLPEVKTFKEFLTLYDQQYPNARSYQYPGANPFTIINRAILQANLATILAGLEVLDDMMTLDFPAFLAEVQRQDPRYVQHYIFRNFSPELVTPSLVLWPTT
jgi:hypothetical protein